MWHIGLDASVPETAAREIMGSHERTEAMPKVDTPREVIRDDTKLFVPRFLCDGAAAIDVTHQVAEQSTAAHGGLMLSAG